VAEAATVTCPACGASAPAGGRYCAQCATPLPAAGPTPAGLTPAGEKPKTSGWLKVLTVAVVAAVVVAVAITAALLVFAHHASKSLNTALTPQPGRPAGYRGPAYPGMLTQDQVAGGAGNRVVADGELLTAGNLTRTAGLFGTDLCTPVTITNQSATTRDNGPYQWKLQRPNGIVDSPTISGTLAVAQVAPGGTASGTVCFPDSGPSGSDVLLWQPLFRVGRAVWLIPS
jgi:hypothetical protein